jgi:hypothetical protein
MKSIFFFPAFQVHYFRKHSLDNEQQVKDKFKVLDALHFVHADASSEENQDGVDNMPQQTDIPDDTGVWLQENGGVHATPVEEDDDDDDEDGTLSEEDKDQLRYRKKNNLINLLFQRCGTDNQTNFLTCSCL